MARGPCTILSFSAILTILPALASLAAGLSQSIRPEISSSILVYGPSDWSQTAGLSRCQQVVDNALSYTQSQVMFVPTGFWVSNVSTSETADINAQFFVDYYCLNRTAGTGSTPTNCAEATQYQIDELTSSMAACFRTATDAGLDIAISPHLDDGLGLGGWRNGLVFDPMEQYGNWTYAEFWLFPLADALTQALTPNTKIKFAMQGEMSATVFYYPDSYTQLLDQLKDRIMEGAPANFSRDNLEVGVSTNFNKLCQCVNQSLVDASAYEQTYTAAFAPVKSSFDLVAISELYNTTDFIGISSYPSLEPEFSPQDLEGATEQFDFELSLFGVDLKHLNRVLGKPLYWNEYGLGGGFSQDGNLPAPTPADAAGNPYFGIFGGYNTTLDPFMLYNLSHPCPVRRFQEYFYNQTLAYAEQTGMNSSFLYNVSGIYLWNGGSWDIQAVYPESTDEEGSWKNGNITSRIDAYNQIAIAQNGGTPAASETAGIAPGTSSPGHLTTGSPVDPVAVFTGTNSEVPLSPVQSSG